MDHEPDPEFPDPPSNAGELSLRFDWNGGGRPSTDVVEAVATTTGDDPTDLPPLHQSVDPEALDAVLAPDEPGGAVCVSLVYAGFRIRLDQDGFELRAIQGDDRRD